MSKARPKILLDADDFMALHLAALANGGIGAGGVGTDEAPDCVVGLASWLDEPKVGYRGADGLAGDVLARRMYKAGLHWGVNDSVVPGGTKVSFEKYIQRLNIDIKE